MKDELAREVASAGEVEELRAILAEACRLTGMGFAAVARVTDTRWIACQVVDNIEFGLSPGEELELRTTICEDIRLSGEAIVIDYVAEDIVWQTHPTPALYGFQSYASFPIKLEDGRFFGTLCAIDPEPRMLRGTQIVEEMQRLAEQAAVILSGCVTEQP
jgi:GAF domain-containing protein